MFDIRKIQEQVIYDNIKAESNADLAGEIVYGKNHAAIADSDRHWVTSTMSRLEDNFDSETIKKIRMNCQCGYGMDEKIALVQELKQSAANLAEFAGSKKAKAAGLSCHDGELYLQFGFCPCPMLHEVDRLETSTWCQCTTGYSKVLFEKVFGCDVDVELLKSVKMGDEICLMKIILHDPIWLSDSGR